MIYHSLSFAVQSESEKNVVSPCGLCQISALQNFYCESVNHYHKGVNISLDVRRVRITFESALFEIVGTGTSVY